MTRKLIIYAIILLNLFLLFSTTIGFSYLSKMPSLVEVSLLYRPTTLLALVGILSLVGIVVGIRALSRSDIEITKDLFP